MLRILSMSENYFTTIAIITLVVVSVNVTSIVPFCAADAHEAQGRRATSKLLRLVVHPKKQTETNERGIMESSQTFELHLLVWYKNLESIEDVKKSINTSCAEYKDGTICRCRRRYKIRAWNGIYTWWNSREGRTLRTQWRVAPSTEEIRKFTKCLSSYVAIAESHAFLHRTTL